MFVERHIGGGIQLFEYVRSVSEYGGVSPTYVSVSFNSRETEKWKAVEVVW